MRPVLGFGVLVHIAQFLRFLGAFLGRFSDIFLCLQKRHFWASALASAPYVIPVS